MSGLFSTLDLARRSMQTQMTAVQVTGQNIANVNTPGYSRQRADMTEALATPTANGLVGSGTQVVRIQQLVSELMNNQIQSQNSDLGFQQGRQTALQSAQDALSEILSNGPNGTGSSGLSSQLTDLFSAFQAVATSPNSTAARQSLIGAAQTLTASFNQVGGKLVDLKSGLNTSLNNDVDSANKYLSQIAGLNARIADAEVSGGTANDLRDQRGLALENLGKLVNFSTSTDTKGQISVSIGGQALVSGRQLADTLKTYDAGGGQMLVQTATGGVNLTLAGGTMQGTIDARDNELASLQSKLDSLASNLISAVNTVHSGGFSPSGTTGANFFTGTSAATISVNSALANNPSLIQASGSAAASGDNSVALQLAQLASAAQAGLGGDRFGNFYGAAVAKIGTALNNANTQVENQQAVGEMLSTQRGAISGVNIDEEMSNMLMFQRSYAASAELLKTVDQMIQTTLAMKQ
jgi:flagellar hook-associated protein 1 FlgK